MRYAFDANMLMIHDDSGPVAAYPVKDYDRDDLGARRHRLMLENGMIVSVVWGPCTYSDNHDCSFVGYGSDLGELVEEPERAELAAWWEGSRLSALEEVKGVLDGGCGGLLDWDGSDTVQGYVPANAFPGILARLSTLPTGATTIPFVAEAT